MESIYILGPSEENHSKQFSGVFLEYKHRFVRFAASYLRNELMAEDIVMESFLYYWENRDSLAVDTNVPAYILVVIKHKCLNHLRNQDTHRKIEGAIQDKHQRLLQEDIISLEACDPQQLFTDEARRIVNRVLASLPSKTKTVFIRSRFRNQSYREIASELGITEKSVEFHVSKALKIFRTALSDYLTILPLSFLSAFEIINKY